MSTSRALPILRTADLQVAYAAVERLLRLVIPLKGFYVSAEAQALTLDEAQRMALAFPEATIAPCDPHWPEFNDEIRELVAAGDPRVLGALPVTLTLDQRPVGSIEEAFLKITGTGWASIKWSWFQWPAVAELGLEPRGKDAFVQIVINSRDVMSEIPAADHTVFIHLRGEDDTRAEWLARQVGLQPIGPWENGL
ncbi:hypothetical protein KDL01_21455 [Actinospica durhamensis]|uniref:Uncharacterized protein n=1 Tax=Actinospica durhamensis TaxID=1508375 RepID=A0A941ER10_9ACTN|nr:hypothetical protein [Actinospica durhamensis]MBR7835855.1 hypothetical protein [Actinospica durhamensis]